MTHLPLLHLRCAITTTLTDTDTARDATRLDAQEAKIYQRFLAPEDRRDYAAAHALLRRTLTAVVPNHPPQTRMGTNSCLFAVRDGKELVSRSSSRRSTVALP
jgi:hypothetical protein